VLTPWFQLAARRLEKQRQMRVDTARGLRQEALERRAAAKQHLAEIAVCCSSSHTFFERSEHECWVMLAGATAVAGTPGIQAAHRDREKDLGIDVSTLAGSSGRFSVCCELVCLGSERQSTGTGNATLATNSCVRAANQAVATTRSSPHHHTSLLLENVRLAVGPDRIASVTSSPRRLTAACTARAIRRHAAAVAGDCGCIAGSTGHSAFVCTPGCRSSCADCFLGDHTSTQHMRAVEETKNIFLEDPNIKAEALR
jgi:hypothetical protein